MSKMALKSAHSECAHHHNHDHHEHANHDHNHSDHDHHHHHGVLGALSQKAGEVYTTIGNAAGGRAHAGRIGRAARVTRVSSNTVAIATGIAGVVIVGTSIASGGLAVPVWLLVAGGVAVAANLAGIALGSGGNHLKISQYYDAMIESNAENSRLLKQLGKNPAHLPHGVSEYWEKDRPLFWMTMGRRGQDIVSTTGTVASGVLLLSAVGALPVAPSAAIGLFFASRGLSASAAVSGSMTNRHRLSVYKEIIHRFGQQYAQLTREHDQEKADRAFSIVEEVFKKLHVPYQITDIKDPHQWRAFNVGYSLYKTLFTQAVSLSLEDTASFLNTANREKIVNGMVATLQPMTKEDRTISKRNWKEGSDLPNRYIGRTQLRKLDAGKNKYSLGDDLAVLDAMPALGMKLEEKLTEDIRGKAAHERSLRIASTIISDLHIHIDKDDTHKTLAFAIRKAVASVAESSDVTITDTVKTRLLPYLKEETGKVKTGRKCWGKAIYEEQPLGTWILNTDKLATDFPAQGHAHGSNFLPFYHMSQLSQALKEGLAKKKELAVTEKGTVVHLEKGHSAHHHEHGACHHHHHHEHDEPPALEAIPKAYSIARSRHVHTVEEPHHNIGRTSDSYTVLKASLVHQGLTLTAERIKVQQERLDSFRQHAKKFILVRKDKDEQDNTTLYLWDDPNNQGKKEHQILYVVHNHTKKISVKYGENASAIIPVNSDIKQGIGVQLIEIAQGQHKVLGDLHNKRIDVLATEKHKWTHRVSLERCNHYQHNI